MRPLPLTDGDHENITAPHRGLTVRGAIRIHTAVRVRFAVSGDALPQKRTTKSAVVAQNVSAGLANILGAPRKNASPLQAGTITLSVRQAATANQTAA